MVNQPGFVIQKQDKLIDWSSLHSPEKSEGLMTPDKEEVFLKLHKQMVYL
jgi:hypothetical protein